MNVTVFATVGQVAVFSKQFSLTPVSGIIVFFFFLQGEKSLESDVVSPSSENGHCCACGFHLL